jgi:predicted DCC family thiol-disulfide oxidoreductase YuxK
MPDKVSSTTVYYDGSCPLCATEIRHYRDQDSNHQLAFVDVSGTDALLPADLNRKQAMARFHVMSRDGSLVDGARAFVEVWASLPKWRWAARAATLPGAMRALDMAYSASLLIRPAISRLFGRLQNSKPGN